MKNDFREFYDEDYILHTAVEGSEDEYITHSLRSTIHKYIDKFKNRLGKWVYVYPEDKNNMAVTYEQEQRKARRIGNKSASVMYEQEQRKARRIGNERAQKVAKFRSTPMKKMAKIDRIADDKLWSKKRGQSEYSIVMNNQERLAKRAAKKAARANEKANIYGSYATQQKRKAASAASKAQKAQIYDHYARTQKSKNLSGYGQSDYARVISGQEKKRKKALAKQRASEKAARYQEYANKMTDKNRKKYTKYGTSFHTYRKHAYK